MFAAASPTEPRLNNDRGAVDKISITRTSYDGKDARGRRLWTVHVKVNDNDGISKMLTDPLTESEYSNPTGSRPGSLSNERAKDYFGKLVPTLGIEDAIGDARADRQISIHEEIQENSASEPSIYCLFWEVLENVPFWKCYGLERVRLCRTWTCHTNQTGLTAQQVRQPSLRPILREEYRILLVVARSFRKDKDHAYRDYPPSLVLGPLLKIASWCNERTYLPNLRVDVVRPGTIGDFEKELKRHEKGYYDLVHLDMHGKIRVHRSTANSLSMVATPYLRFGKHYKEDLRPFGGEDPIALLMEDDDSLADTNVADVALLLEKHCVTKVALSACLSSYAQHDMLANMCHIFLRHGAVEVSAMSFQVLQETARIYYAHFYEALLVNGQSFLSAAAAGREALRAKPGQFANASVPTNYHRAARVSTNDFWPPEHRLRWTKPRLLAAYCLRWGAIMTASYLFLTCFFRFSWSNIFWGRLGIFSLASMVWHGSVIWVQRLQCPRWLWMPYAATIFQPDENLKLLSQHIEIEHLVLEDRLELEAKENEGNGLIYLFSEDAKAELGQMVARLAPVWVLTGFIDTAVVISAMVFKSPQSVWEWWLRLWYTAHKSDTIHGNDLGRRHLVVITDYDRLHYFYHRRQDMRGWEGALERMAMFAGRYRVEAVEIGADDDSKSKNSKDENSKDDHKPEKAYLIITGSLNDDKWRLIQWPVLADKKDEGIIITNIGQAKPHLHNVTASF